MEQSHSTERMYDDLTSANIHISSISWIFFKSASVRSVQQGGKKGQM